MRWLLTILISTAMSLSPFVASAQSNSQPITLAQVVSAFQNVGYQTETPIDWGWLNPAVSTLVVHDRSNDRVLTAFIFPDTTSASVFRGQIAAHLETDASAPHMLDGYGPSIWTANVAMVQSTQSHLDRLAGLRSAHNTGMYGDADLHTPDIPVDLDFQQALRESVVKL